MNIQKRDRFELLSAYLDGEVTSAEKRQVEEWLDNDAETQKLYARLLALRQNFQALPPPATTQSVEQTIQQVFGKIEKRRQHRSLKWGGAAIAALVIATLSSIVPGRQVLQMADVSNPTNTEEKLLVALNTPLVELPETDSKSQKIEQNKP
ncbi:MAG: Fis family transcriptional regulator [Chroococcus sp. CMT-3BRIN-NPC107]|jgi:anti-sigma factor RsiW|nr:Fis family transcriptional regulator [Chroococcus sp. CMT-3BRIN-NPC107]